MPRYIYATRPALLAVPAAAGANSHAATTVTAPAGAALQRLPPRENAYSGHLTTMNNSSLDHWRRGFLTVAALFGCIAVAVAAIGAHAFADILIGKAAVRYDTALRMHLIHAPALLALASSLQLCSPRWWLTACILMSLGTLVFCGGLYLAAIGISPALLPIVPAGGSALILSWLAAAIGFARGKRSL